MGSLKALFLGVPWQVPKNTLVPSTKIHAENRKYEPAYLPSPLWEAKVHNLPGHCNVPLFPGTGNGGGVIEVTARACCFSSAWPCSSPHRSASFVVKGLVLSPRELSAGLKVQSFSHLWSTL